MTLVLAVAGFLVFFLAVLHLHTETAAFREWEFVLNPESLRVYSMVATEIRWQRAMAETSYEDALGANRQGDTLEALRHLDLGARVVGECSDSLLNLLRNTTVLARQAAAIAPSEPFLPSQFNARTLSTLAGLHWVGHHLLVSTRDRLAFRLRVIGLGVREAVRLVRRSTWSLQTDMADARRWRRVDEVRGDLGTLTDESLETLRLVLVSLVAVPQPEPVRERKAA